MSESITIIHLNILESKMIAVQIWILTVYSISTRYHKETFRYSLRIPNEKLQCHFLTNQKKPFENTIGYIFLSLTDHGNYCQHYFIFSFKITNTICKRINCQASSLGLPSTWIEMRERQLLFIKKPLNRKGYLVTDGNDTQVLPLICFPKPKQCFPSAEFYHWTDPASQNGVSFLMSSIRK